MNNSYKSYNSKNINSQYNDDYSNPSDKPEIAIAISQKTEKSVS